MNTKIILLSILGIIIFYTSFFFIYKYYTNSKNLIQSTIPPTTNQPTTIPPTTIPPTTIPPTTIPPTTIPPTTIPPTNPHIPSLTEEIQLRSNICSQLKTTYNDTQPSSSWKTTDTQLWSSSNCNVLSSNLNFIGIWRKPVANFDMITIIQDPNVYNQIIVTDFAGNSQTFKVADTTANNINYNNNIDKMEYIPSTKDIIYGNETYSRIG
jgi:hypothetical protein